MLPFSCLLTTTCEKHGKILPDTLQKKQGISFFILTGLCIFNCHFLRSVYIYK